MTQLERIAERAKTSANLCGKPVAVFNMNRVGAPMYVIREADSFKGEDRMVAGPFEPAIYEAFETDSDEAAEYEDYHNIQIGG